MRLLYQIRRSRLYRRAINRRFGCEIITYPLIFDDHLIVEIVLLNIPTLVKGHCLYGRTRIQYVPLHI